jgi:hypothetical protein
MSFSLSCWDVGSFSSFFGDNACFLGSSTTTFDCYQDSMAHLQPAAGRKRLMDVHSRACGWRMGHTCCDLS